MTAFVFAGPSLAGADLVLQEDFVLAPPARQGDVYRAAQSRPAAIGIVDGYFEGVPSVWHKEILWALSRGISVYGSASIGALRAAEMQPCGVIGVGEIFSAYRDGTLEADDEVALLHAPAEAGFVGLTEPLVNVRATCRAALVDGALAEEEAELIVAVARSTFYKERTWRLIGRRILAVGFSEDRHARFLAWLATGRVDQKRRDALLMIERMQADRGAHPDASRDFAPTFLWERAVAGWQRGSKPLPGQGDLGARVLDELRLDPERYLRLKERARAHMQALGGADGAAVSVAHSDVADAQRRHRLALGLLRARDLGRWLAEQRLDHGQYEQLVAQAALAHAASQRESVDLRSTMLALLKLDGAFGPLADRAETKAQAAAAGGRQVKLPASVVLLDWFFRVRLGEPMPQDIDAFARALGFASRDALYGLLAAEYIYSRAQGANRRG